MVVIAILCCIYANEIVSFLAKKMGMVGICPEDIYDALEKYEILNVLGTIGIVIALGQLLISRYKDRNCSLLKIAVAVDILILLYVQSKWVFAATVICAIKYDTLIFVGLSLYLLTPLVTLVVDYVKDKWIRKNPQTKILTLYSDTEEKVSISESRAKYADHLAARLLNTDISKEAYALGIVGEWGSGKTLFLDQIAQMVKDQAIVVRFNPWNSKNEQHFIKDFLRTLSKALSPYYSGISSPISKYASLLYSLRVHVMSDYILQYLPKHEEKDLAQRKKDVEEALSKIGKPVVVFIDDIDRLEGKEIFEVLRIIRNTAVFSHVVYVVAYDKAHVLSQLTALNIGNGADYLEKIFQMEVEMPKPDERMLIDELKVACRVMAVATSPINSVLTKLTDEDYHQIIKVLTSYRKIKRFARQFSFNASFMLQNFTNRDFELQDLFFISLIEYDNSELYKRVWRKPEALFDVKDVKDENVKYYFWDSDRKDNSEVIGNGSVSEYLMKRLFGKEPDNKTHSIQFVDAFYKYFYLAQPEKELSLKEFEEMLGKSSSHVAHDGMMTTIRSWVASKENKSCSSIYRAFVKYDTLSQKDYQKCYNFLEAVFYWIQLEDREYEHMKDLLPQVLNKSRFKEQMRDNVTQRASAKVRFLADKEKFYTAAIVMSELYRRLDSGEKLLVEMKDVEAALKRNTEQFLKSKAWDPICLFRNDGNMMRLVIGACCVPLKSKLNRKVNLVMEQVIAYYSENDHMSNSYRDANELLRLFPYQTVFSYRATQNSGLDDLMPVFGDDIEQARKLLTTCFNGVDANKAEVK